MGRHSSDEDEGLEKMSEDSDLTSSDEDLKSKKKSKKSKHSSAHKKKKSKDKKHKKRSKKHRKRSTSSEGSSDSEQEVQWVVKSQSTTESGLPPDDDKKTEEGFKKPKLDSPVPVRAPTAKDEDEWMDFSSAMPTFSNDAKRSERRKQKEQQREQSSIDKPGVHVNELNPYWKDGGMGLPDEETVSKPKETETQMIGDGGLSYLRKAFIRAKEQAKEEGRTLEEILSGRWGSLENFLSKLEAAEKKAEQMNYRPRRDDHRQKFKRPNRDSDDEDYHRQSEYSSRDRRHERHRHMDRRRSRSRDRNSESSLGWRKRRESSERSSKKTRSPERSRRKTPSPEAFTRRETSPRIRDRESSKDSTTASSISKAVSRSMELDDKPEDMELEKEVPKPLTDKEMNELGAKLLKAEMLGNTELMEELKKKISDAEATRQDFIKNGNKVPSNTTSTKVVTKVIMDSSRGRKKDKITETHKDGQRVRYFPDDDKQTLKNMFQKEKMNTAEDENALFARLAGKSAKAGIDYDADDVFTDKASSSKQATKEQEREVRDVLEQEKQYTKIIDNCQWCFDGNVVQKHLIVSVAEKCYLSVPPYQSLSEGHCLIVPMSHVSSATELDEDVWSEMQKFRKALVRMFRELDQDMVIFETAMFLKSHPHMYLECIPMPKETGELAPIYFKKAIQECETEWSHNKKLVDLRNRDVRRAVPKGLPYFSVDFGDDSCGFAHVVEDEKNFPRNFAHEIVGGMMELDHHLWRKQKKDDFKTQRNKVMEFLKQWGPFDWTRDPS